MKKIILSVVVMWFVQSCEAQVFTFECFCGYLTTADANCDICTSTLQSRLFSGIIIRKNGTPYKWIDAPYTIKFNGDVARFQELVFPNPESINIDRSQTAYGTLDSFKLAIDCPCTAGVADTVVIPIDTSACGCCDSLLFFVNDTAANAYGLNRGDYYLLDQENYYGMAWGIVKLLTEDVPLNGAFPPGCLDNVPAGPLSFFTDDTEASITLSVGDYYLLDIDNPYGMAWGTIKIITEP